LPMTIFSYGWTAHYVTRWTVPVAMLLPYGFGIMALFLSVGTYFVDSRPVYAGSALAANVVLRSLTGALLPLAGPSMYALLGLGWGNSLLEFICVAMMSNPVKSYKFGAR
ncbi:hypothetical protein T440DRAFT_394874, partial [Plenodomus tracheiphilus IPT5]